VELRSLCDTQVRAAIREEGIRLISFREYARIAGRSGQGAVAAGCSPAASGR
jgi:hypothetical protein